MRQFHKQNHQSNVFHEGDKFIFEVFLQHLRAEGPIRLFKGFKHDIACILD